MTGREAYEEDVRRKPFYEDGRPRKQWDQLTDLVQRTWEFSPTPRNWPPDDRDE